MNADAVQLLALVLIGAWVVQAARLALVARGRDEGRTRRVAVLAAGGAAVLLFAGQAVLADHVDDAGGLPTAYDSQVWAFVLDHRAAPLTVVAEVFDRAGGTLALGALAALAGAVLVLRGHRRDALLVASALLVSTAVTAVAKPAYGRPRPPLAERLTDVSGYSLPSGHTLDATVVLGVLAVVVVARLHSTAARVAVAAAATLAVTAAGAARVYLGVHWATDVLTGWLLGGALVALYAAAVVGFGAHRPGDAVEPVGPAGDTSHRAPLAA